MMHTLSLLVTLASASSVDAGVAQIDAMQNALKAVLHLQPSLTNAATFKAAAPTLQADLEALTQVEHAFQSSDPGARSIASILSAEIARAREALRGGETESARARLKGLTSLCFNCHTLAASVDRASAAEPAAELTPFERASFFAATRRFDDALALWLVALKRAPSSAQQAFEQLHALRQAIAVAVSVKDDPVKTLELLDAHALGEVDTTYTARSLSAWRNEVKHWSLERFDARRASAKQLFVRGKALVDQSHAAQHILADESKTIGLFRATAYLTQALNREPRATWRSEALFNLGVATATVRDPMLWGLDGVYLEACIRENPGTAIAARCFSVLLDRTVFGFTGSSGTVLPSDVDSRLQTLAKLAAPSRK